MPKARFELIVGPMGASKSAELYTRYERLRIGGHAVRGYMPAKNYRDQAIQSRSGLSIPTQKIDSIHDINGASNNVIVDEVHLFGFPPNESESEVDAVRNLLNRRINVTAALIDINYLGRMMPIFEGLYELGPDEIFRAPAACLAPGCDCLDARHTGLWQDGIRKREGDDLIVDGASEEYRALCREHFDNLDELPPMPLDK